jgi:Mrp family chromosome partitioning ATPase/capsular polysaccharide biosynthesis protein
MNDAHSQQEALDLRAYLRPIWRRKWIVLAIAVVAAAATYLISSHQQKAYVSNTTLYVTDADPTLDITTPASNGVTGTSLANVAQLITAASVTNAVSRTLGRPASSAGSVVATASTVANFVTVTATSQNPIMAARLANTYVTAYLDSRAQAVAVKARRDEQAAQLTLASLQKNTTTGGERQTLLQQIGTYRQAVLNPSSGAQVTNRAAVPVSPISPRPKRDAIFGGVVGLVLGLIVAFCLDLLDRRLVSVATVESAFGRPVLAVLPHVSDPTPLLDGSRAVVPPQFLEELRSLTVMLRLGNDSEPPRTIMVTSTLPQEGKSTITRDLALVYAGSGARVLVIDGDLRRPSMERVFGISSEQGLVQILRGEASLTEAAVVAVAAQGGAKPSTNGHARSKLANGDDPGLPGSVDLVGSVDLIAHGTRLESPLALMSSGRMATLLEEASRRYDIVLLDTAPVLVVADSVPLMEVVDTVLVVARLGQTTRHSAKRFVEIIERLSIVTFSGVIANDRRGRFDEEGYGTYGRYGYDYGKRRKGEQTTAEPSEAKAGTTAE